ncbi:MAG: ATPase [Pseudomonadota bacterium]|nr:ATPase [Pseudomonadota bacterium]
MRGDLIFAFLIVATPASAEVIGASDHGFEIQHSVNLVVPAAQTFAAFGRVGQWWGKDHTYSGDSARMSIQMRPGGCWCETLEGGGGIEHMRVTFVKPGEQVVFTGSLGPLLYEATSGVMHVKVDPIAGGSKITMNYRAAGFANGGAAKMAPLVDKVLADQMKRFRAYAAAAPKPDTLKP